MPNGLMNAVFPTKLLEFYQYKLFSQKHSDKFPLELEIGQQKKIVDVGTITQIVNRMGLTLFKTILASQFNYQQMLGIENWAQLV